MKYCDDRLQIALFVVLDVTGSAETQLRAK